MTVVKSTSLKRGGKKKNTSEHYCHLVDSGCWDSSDSENVLSEELTYAIEAVFTRTLKLHLLNGFEVNSSHRASKNTCMTQINFRKTFSLERLIEFG